MARGNEMEELELLRAQANAVRHVTQITLNEAVRELADGAADRLERFAKSLERKQRKVLNDGVLVIPDDASNHTLNSARLRRAVRRGRDVFLPAWREAAVGLPNILLRSALFSANKNAGEPLMEQSIASQGKTELTFTGLRLDDYDRRVFAACLQYYRIGLPLSPDDGGGMWVKVTFWELSQAIRSSYGKNVHIAIRDSLVRLNAAHLRIRVEHMDIPMPRLIEVVFDDGSKGPESSTRSPKGSDLVAFRVQESMANLFGPAAWTAVCVSAIHDHSGLTSWLASFYSTHASPFALFLNNLHEQCGAVCSLPEFRRRLKNGLERLQQDDVPKEFRVASFEMDKRSVTVRLVRWGER